MTKLKKKLIIGLDIDDVLFPFTREFVKFANSQLHTHKTMADVTEYSLEQAFDVSRTVIIDLIEDMMTQDWIEDIKPIGYENIYKVLDELKPIYEIQIITARLNNYKVLTSKWMKKYFDGYYTKIHHCSFSSPMPNRVSGITKGQKCLEIGASIMIDDSPENITDCYNSGIKTILFGNYKWQDKLPQNVQTLKARNWQEVKKLLLVNKNN